VEREEQQRIKNLVLNLDLQSEEQDGECYNHVRFVGLKSNIDGDKHAGHERPTSYHHNRQEKPGKDRQRVRKLQLSDVVDWYARS